MDECATAATSADWSSPVTYAKLVASICLVVLSGLFSGLTLGLMGLDKVGLQIVMTSGEPTSAGYAKKIAPLRENGNFLLCTLLLGNVMVNSALSILSADLASGLYGFIISTAVITVFGEITPQAACSRYSLYIGAHTVWIVKIFMSILFVIAYPLSVVLDWALGEELGTIYTKSELKRLVELHVLHRTKSGLKQEEATIMSGALEFSRKSVRSVMTNIGDTFMLEINGRMDGDTLTRVWQTGFSRVPVYEDHPRNIVSILVTKDLILLSPDESIPIRTLVALYGRSVLTVFPDMHLDELLSHFKTGHSHMAVVKDVVEPEGGGDPYYETVGLITLEDVIEEIIQDEIVDETDVYVDMSSRQRVTGQRERQREYLMLSRALRAERLTPQQVLAVGAFLTQVMPAFRVFPKDALHALLSQSPLMRIDADNHQKPIYTKETPSDVFTLVLQGRVTVTCGADNFEAETGPWGFLGARVFTSPPPFLPDFTAVPQSDAQTLLLQIPRDLFLDVLAAVKSPKLPSEMKWMYEAIEERKENADITEKYSENTETDNELLINMGGGGTNGVLVAAESFERSSTEGLLNK